MVVGERSVVHHLQEDVEDVGVRLLYLVEEQHAVGRLAHGSGEQSAVLVAHVSCGRTDEFSHGVLLGVLAHVEAHELHAHPLGEHARHLGLAHAGRTDEEQTCHRLGVVGESGFRHLHSLNHTSDGFVLTEYLLLYVALQRAQRVVRLLLECFGINLADTCEYVGEEPAVYGLTLLRGERMRLAVGTCLVDEVDGFVGQEAVAYVLGSAAHGKLNDAHSVLHAVELLVARAQTLHDAYCVVYRRLGDVYLLKAAHERLLLGYVAVVLVVGGRADEAYRSALEVGLQHVRRVERCVAVASGSDEVVYLVDAEYGVALLRESFHHHLDALLEVATELCACHHRAHVHHVDVCSAQAFGHLATLYEGGESVDERCLANARLAHVQRIVLVLAAEHLHGALQFGFATDERVMSSVCVVDTGDKLAPWCEGVGIVIALCAFARLVYSVCRHERLHKLALLVARELVEKIGCLRVVEHEHGCHDVRHVERVLVGVLRLLDGERHHLGELLRTFDDELLRLGHHLHREELLLELGDEPRGIVRQPLAGTCELVL